LKIGKSENRTIQVELIGFDNNSVTNSPEEKLTPR
jgi:hypothetical protein